MRDQHFSHPIAQGVDVSDHNKGIDWDRVKDDDMDFALLRMGYGSDLVSQDDNEFERNVRECERVGLPWGAYLYSYALDIDHAKSEVAHARRLLKGKKPVLVAFDMEDADHYKLNHGMPSKETIADICDVWLSAMEADGHDVRLYANMSWLTNILDSPKLDRYYKWVADWDNECSYAGNFDIWQYYSSGRVNGIAGRVDMNYSYRHFAAEKHVEEHQQTKAEHITNHKSKWHKKNGHWHGDLLKRWDYGEPVRDLQEMLCKAYFYPNKGAKNNGVDSYFGGNTEDAVKRFQTMHGLKVDGLAGKHTYEKLRKTNEPKHHHSHKNSHHDSKAVVPYPGHLFRVKSPLMHGENVKRIQRALNSTGDHLRVDGWYGNDTANAVGDYQRRHGLEVDEICGRQTWNTLF